MDDQSLDQPAANEVAPASPQRPQRRMWKPLILGFLAGWIPLGSSAVFGPLLSPLSWRWGYLVLGIYCVAWVGAVSTVAFSSNQSYRSFAKALMVGLAASPMWALIGFIIFTLIFCSFSGGCRLTG